jgi:AraC-like DNA-binding protein
MDVFIALVIFSSIAVLSCFFASTYFVFIRNEDRFKDFTLGLLFLAIALRLSKSVLSNLFPDLAPTVLAFGFLGYATIAPLFYLYYKYSITVLNKFEKKHLLHLIFPMVGFFLILYDKTLTRKLFMIANTIVGLSLIIVAYQYLFNNLMKNILSKWHYYLFFGMIGIFSAFTIQFFLRTIKSYTIGTVLASVILYFLFFAALKSPVLIKKTSNKKVTISEGLKNKIVIAIETDKMFLLPDITLTKFSKEIDAPNYLITKAMKSIYNKNFPEVINGFRIEAIKVKLKNPDYIDDRIEDLAYEVGFNTSSAFYNAFKKETNLTPRGYQKEYLNAIKEV